MHPKAQHIPYVPEDGIPEKGTYQCPYCGIQVTLTPLKWTMEHIIYSCDNPGCQKSFYAKVKYLGSTVGINETTYRYEILETYPKLVSQKHEAIPQKIWVDYLEASQAYDVGAYKASVVMCRRTMQNVCLEHGAIKVDSNGRYQKLKDQIKQAFPQKDYSLIHAYADKIKYFGDYGAHPQDDNIDDVTKETAKKVLDFTLEILKIGYIVEWELKKLDS